MKLRTASCPFLYLFIILFLPCTQVAAQKMITEQKFIKKRLKAFDEIKLDDVDGVYDVDLTLWKTTADFYDSLQYDGFWFRVPKGQQGKDLVWFFNIPRQQVNWYIVPLDEEDHKPGFRYFMENQLIFTYDEDLGPNRQRFMQTLTKSYFTEGKRYAIWFKKMGPNDGEKDDVVLRVRLMFRDSREVWNRDILEEVLELEPSAVDKQLGWNPLRGGEILVDETLFDPEFATKLINRGYRRQRINMEGPNKYFRAPVADDFRVSKMRPALSSIIEKYGPPDFVQHAQEVEWMKRDDVWMYEHADEAILATAHYGVFGFQVNLRDPQRRVLRVFAHGVDTDEFVPFNPEPHIKLLPSMKLMVFYQDRKEVGRIYDFLGEGNSPAAIKDPPPGEYRLKSNYKLSYQGQGKGVLIHYTDSGEEKQRIPLDRYKLEGLAWTW